jgi:hypothetical protein
MVKFGSAGPISQEMSLEAVLGRIDQILAYRQALVDPGSLTTASPASTSSGFAAQLASAQASQSSASAPLGSDTPSSAVSPFTSSPSPTSFDVSGVGGTTGLSGSAKMLAAAKAALGGAYNQGNHDAASDSAS